MRKIIQKKKIKKIFKAEKDFIKIIENLISVCIEGEGRWGCFIFFKVKKNYNSNKKTLTFLLGTIFSL